VDLTITEENDGEVDLTNPYVEVTQEGALIATLVAPPDSGDDGNGILDTGETWTWTITSDPITVDPTNFVATGYGTDPLGNVITYPEDPDEQDDVQVDLLAPSTDIDISSSATRVLPGDTVELTITEENDGSVPLTDVYVEVTQQGTLIATLIAPPDSGDDGDGVLDVVETWSWTITSDPITEDPTTFVATGYGTDPLGNVITWPDDPEERDDVTVRTRICVGGSVSTQSITEILLPWLGILAVVMIGTVVLVRRRLFS
jgi:hypothetical protein